MNFLPAFSEPDAPDVKLAGGSSPVGVGRLSVAEKGLDVDLATDANCCTLAVCPPNVKELGNGADPAPDPNKWPLAVCPSNVKELGNGADAIPDSKEAINGADPADNSPEGGDAAPLPNVNFGAGKEVSSDATIASLGPPDGDVKENTGSVLGY